MATEKQVSYIKNLVNGLRFENVPYLNQPEKLNDPYYIYGAREWMLRGLYRDFNSFSEKFDAMDYAAATSAWNTRIAELEQMDFSQLDNRQASQMIDSLKKFFIGA